MTHISPRGLRVNPRTPINSRPASPRRRPLVPAKTRSTLRLHVCVGPRTQVRTIGVLDRSSPMQLRGRFSRASRRDPRQHLLWSLPGEGTLSAVPFRRRVRRGPGASRGAAKSRRGRQGPPGASVPACLRAHVRQHAQPGAAGVAPGAPPHAGVAPRRMWDPPPGGSGRQAPRAVSCRRASRGGGRNRPLRDRAARPKARARPPASPPHQGLSVSAKGQFKGAAKLAPKKIRSRTSLGEKDQKSEEARGPDSLPPEEARQGASLRPSVERLAGPGKRPGSCI
jgi:hypothetical protein